MAWFAPCYDAMLATAEWSWLAQRRRSLLAGLRGVVVEIGAGTGANLPHYPSEDVELHLCEPDPDMRAVLERKLAGRARVTVHAAAAEALPFGDGSVDTVISTLVLCSVADVDRAVAESFRVLRPGGELRFLEHVASEGWRGAVQRGLDPIWHRCAGGCHLHRDPLAAVNRHAPAVVERDWPVAMPPFLHPLLVGRAAR
jgi:ubiquinone/menaquinone biosynthesis C-methylase UbiE